jgi:hypothetical protein
MTKIDDAVKELMKADTKILYQKLGAYASTFPRDPAQFASPQAAVTADVAHAGPMDEAVELGKRVLRRWNKTLHGVVCGGVEDVDADARNKIMTAIKLQDPTAIAASITGVLIGVFSVGPAIATVVGVLVGKILLPAAGQEVCAFWKERL